MKVEIITKEDLQVLKFEIVSEIKCLLESTALYASETLEGYRNKEAREVLKCSAGKLKSLRIAGKIRFKKIGGTIYYSKKDIMRLVTEGF